MMDEDLRQSQACRSSENWGHAEDVSPLQGSVSHAGCYLGLRFASAQAVTLRAFSPTTATVRHALGMKANEAEDVSRLEGSVSHARCYLGLRFALAQAVTLRAFSPTTAERLR
jgi:hypothetical protein